jgi:hypothetical protein
MFGEATPGEPVFFHIPVPAHSSHTATYSALHSLAGGQTVVVVDVLVVVVVLVVLVVVLVVLVDVVVVLVVVVVVVTGQATYGVGYTGCVLHPVIW